MAWMLRRSSSGLNPFGASETCDQTYGFLPCTTTVVGNLFLILAYSYLMFLAATYLSKGSELLLEILGPGITGGLFLPILSAFPDAVLILGIAGGGVGLVSKHRKVHGLANISATYATNFAIVTGCYCGAREFVRVSRASTPDDLLNSAIAGFGSGAILGRLQGGQVGAIRYSIIFGVVGTTVDFATLKLKPSLKSFYESIMGNNDSSQKNGDWLRLPEWSPIQVLDEEALAAKKAREQQLYAQRNVHNLNEEKS